LVIDEQIKEIVNRNYRSVIMTSISAAGLGIGAAVAAFIAEIIVIIIRCINFGLINHNIKLFLYFVSCS
jgi:uncharacterized Tic20 family protein